MPIVMRINDICLYNIVINDSYVYFTNLNIAKNGILILDLIGTKNTQFNTITGLVIPVLSSTGAILGAITAGIKIYNKRKGMILEI